MLMNGFYDFLELLFIVVFLGGLLLILGVIIRFSIISPILTRGAKRRLRQPDINGVISIVGFTPDPALSNFYQEWPHLEKTEYFLVDPTNSAHNRAADLHNSAHQIDGDNHAIWFIGGFEALGKWDVKEMVRVCGRHGLPIATDLNKGVYFLQENGSIELWSPNVVGGHVKVAESIGKLMTFKIVEYEEIFPGED